MGMLDKITKLKRNRTFGYSPRYYKSNSDGSPFKIEPRFDKFRTTLNGQRGLKNKLGNAMADTRREGDRNLKIRFLVILGILVFIFLFLIDFDLSIFLPN